MTRLVGLDVSQKLTSICVVDETGRRLWRGQCSTDPEQLERVVEGHAGKDARVGLETGPMTPWLVHALRERGLDVVCLDARHASATARADCRHATSMGRMIGAKSSRSDNRLSTRRSNDKPRIVP